MTHFIVCYDKEGRETPPVEEKLVSLSGIRLLDSVWIVSLNLSAEALRDELRRVSNPNLEPRCMFEDSIFVMEIPNGCNWSSVNAQGYAVIWLANNIREP
jgi:hypothetical protein